MCALLPGNLQQRPFGGIVVCGKLVGMSKARERVDGVMPLVINVGPGKLVIVTLLIISGIAQRGQRLRGVTVFAFSNVGICQADGYGIV